MSEPSPIPKVDPAKFIVRSTGYPQNREYPLWCAKTVEDALAQGDALNSINNVFDFFTERMQKDQPNFRQRDRGGDYGKTRNPGHTLATDVDLHKGEVPSFTRMLRREHPIRSRIGGSPPFEKTISFRTHLIRDAAQHDENDTLDVSLTNIHYKGKGKAVITHPVSPMTPEMLEENIAAARLKDNGTAEILESLDKVLYDGEHRWALISNAFSTALDMDEKLKTRKENALLCYYLLSHDAPLKTGSSTFARLTLEYMSQRINQERKPDEMHQEFKIPYCKPGVDLNIEALTRDWQDFHSAWKNDSFFDRKSTSDDILAWQQRHLTHGR